MEIDKFSEWLTEFPELDALWNKLPLVPKKLFEIQIQNYAVEQVNKNFIKPVVSGELAVSDECKCIRFTGGDKWYANGCKIHPNG